MEDQSITHRKMGTAVILISPGKKLDNGNASDMDRIISEAQAEGVLDIRIDMSELDLLSSAGIGSILGSVEQTREAGGDITLWNPQEKITHVLEILDLVDYLTVKTGDVATATA